MIKKIKCYCQTILKKTLSRLLIVYYEYFNANDWNFVLRSIQFHFSIFLSSRIYLFSILLKELYVNFRFLIMCKMGMSRISTIMENFNYMHILMVSVGSFVINWFISNDLQCEIREILYSKITIHIELYIALKYKIITALYIYPSILYTYIAHFYLRWKCFSHSKQRKIIM